MNTILIVSDTFRYDFLGINGNRWIKTEELDKFGKMSLVFDNCHTGSFPTIPQRTDMITGRFIFPYDGWCRLKNDWIPVAEYLNENGYLTQLICDTPHLMKRGYNFDRGFDGYWWERGQEADIPFTRMNYPVKEILPHNKTRADYKLREKPEIEPAIPFETTLLDRHKWVNREWRYEEDRFMAKTGKNAIRWIEENYNAEKFFLWVDFFDVHEPWDPPEYIVKMYDPDYKGVPIMHPNYGPADIYTREELKNLKAHYAGEVTLVSKWIGLLLRKVEEVGLLDKTAIIFTSDHGMYLGEHNRTGKSNICKEDKRGPWPLYNEITHIPLMVFIPGAKHRRIKKFVQPVDIMPTILELTNLKIPENIDGISLLTKKSRQFVVSAIGPVDKSKVYSVRDKNYVYVRSGDDGKDRELFDIIKDPGEKHNIIKKHPEIAEKLEKKFQLFMKNHRFPVQ